MAGRPISAKEWELLAKRWRAEADHYRYRVQRLEKLVQALGGDVPSPDTTMEKSASADLPLGESGG